MKSFFKSLAMAAVALLGTQTAQAAVDPNFYIFLCFGQSNMEALPSLSRWTLSVPVRASC